MPTWVTQSCGSAYVRAKNTRSPGWSSACGDARRGVVLQLRGARQRHAQLAEDQLHQAGAVEADGGIGASEDIRHPQIATCDLDRLRCRSTRADSGPGGGLAIGGERRRIGRAARRTRRRQSSPRRAGAAACASSAMRHRDRQQQRQRSQREHAAQRPLRPRRPPSSSSNADHQPLHARHLEPSAAGQPRA